MKKSDNFSAPSFSLKNKMARVFWGVIEESLFRFSPKPFFVWRSFLLRCYGAKVDAKVRVYPKVKIWAPWNLELGSECVIANGVTLYSQGKIIIGKRAVISQGAHLVTGSHDYSKSSFPLYTKPITIGNHVWVAAESFIHPGIVVGDGCVIGARSVVTKHMPEWMVCAGHPCVAIKKRIDFNL